MNTRASTRTRLSIIPVFIALILNILMVAPITPALSNSALALTGSSFDATDGNLVVDGSETDWCSPGLVITRKDDLATGQTDDSYAEGAKENDLNPAVEFGSIPNNKVDLQRTYLTSETSVDGDLFVYVGWVRSDTTGTGTITFELNQSDVTLSNGVNRQRTIGDLLIEFDFQANPGSLGGYDVTLSYRTWTGSAWSDATSLAGFADGSVNEFDSIVDCLNGGEVLGEAQFGEFALNLTDLLGGDCRAFVSLFAKSRASNQITSTLKDLIKPADVDLSTCGQITILKQDENQQALGGATFSVTPNPYTLTGSLSVTDNTAPDDNAAAGTIHLSDIEPGEYTVCETAAPAGYIIDTTCQVMTVGVNGAVTFGPFTNGLGDISWTKVNAQSGLKVCCATFTLVGTAGAALGFSRTVTDNGANDEDPDAGELLVTDLKLGTYRITETVAPTGYDLPTTTFQDVALSGQTASATNPFQDPPQADASITKTAALDAIVAGQDASFDIVVTAGGTGDSEAVVLTDLNATSHTWVVSGVDSTDCTSLIVAPDASLSCDFGTVPNGETRTVTITMTSDTEDCELGIANTASVSSTNDHDASNNEASDSITVNCPNPGVTKEAVADPIVAGEDASFTVTVTAGGTGAAANVNLSDLNDTGHAWTVTGDDAAACADTSVADGETLSCTWASIPAGESRTITITMTSDAADCANGIANTASITAEADVDDSNNEAGADIEVLCPDPSVVKTADIDPITAGDDASFDIVVTAGGTGDSEGVVLSDLNETAHTWTVSGADASACADLSVAPGETLSCDFGTIPTEDDRTITITMMSDADDCANGIANTATISADADVDDSNNESSASIEVLCPDLEIEKSTDTPQVSAGDVVRYTITVSNETGDAEARNVTISDDLPNGLDWTEDSEDCVIDVDGNLLCEDLTIPAGESFSVTLTGTTDSDDCPSIENTAEFTSSNGGSDSSDSGQRGSTLITVDCPDVTVDKEPVESPISAGEQGQFTIEVTNNGPGTAYDVEMTDTAPPGTVWTVLDADGASCSSVVGGDQQALTCLIDELADGASVTILIGYATSRDDCGSLDNAVAVSAGNEPSESTEDNVDEASIIVECPGLNLIKEADADPIHAGDEASFTITVWNAGPGDAFDVELHDDLPAGLSWDFEIVSGDASDTDCMMASSLVDGGIQHQSIDCDFGTLLPTSMEDGIVILVFADTDRTSCGLLENTATADGSNLDEPLTSSDSILVKCPTLTLDKVASTELITITGPDDAMVATPSVVTWTLTYTLADGPVTNAVITDEIPLGFEFLDAADGGTLVDGAVTWTFPTLTESGSVTFRTTVDPETISRVAPTVNVAIIVSDETPEDDGEDSVRVTREEELGGNPTPTPRPSLPDTSAGIGLNGEPIAVPIELLAAFFIGSLGGLTLVNVKARNRRR